MCKSISIKYLGYERCVVTEIFLYSLSCNIMIYVVRNIYEHSTVLFPVSHSCCNTGQRKLVLISPHNFVYIMNTVDNYFKAMCNYFVIVSGCDSNIYSKYIFYCVLIFNVLGCISFIL